MGEFVGSRGDVNWLENDTGSSGHDKHIAKTNTNISIPTLLI